MWKLMLGLLIALFIGGCSKGGSSSSDAPTPTTENPALGALPPAVDSGVLSTVSIPSYATDITPILNAKCASCHRGVSSSSKRDLSSYSAVMKFVTAGNSASSVLYQRVESGAMPPQGSPALSLVENATIKNWIDSGAHQ